MKSVLVVSPHPDDESLGCGGLIALLEQKGCDVHIALVTDGRASHSGFPSCQFLDLASIRANEARAAALSLGIHPSKLLEVGAVDGTLSHLSISQRNEIVCRLAAILRSMQPDSIVLPVRHDGSTEHDASFQLTIDARRQSGITTRILEFPIWAWRNPLLLLRILLSSRRIWRVPIDNVLSSKVSAIKAHESQIKALTADTPPLLSGEFLSEFFVPEEFFFED